VSWNEPAAAAAPSFEPIIGGGGESSLLGGLVGAAVGAVAASVLWYGVVAVTSMQIGLVAIVVGFVVGKAAVFGAGGRGSIPLVAVSAVFTLAALVVSEYLIVYHFIAQEFGTEGLISVVQPVDFVVGVALESVQADPLTLLFWAFALFQAVAIPWAAMRGASQPAPMQPA
jgi:hypothetical protein